MNCAVLSEYDWNALDVCSLVLCFLYVQIRFDVAGNTNVQEDDLPVVLQHNISQRVGSRTTVVVVLANKFSLTSPAQLLNQKRYHEIMGRLMTTIACLAVLGMEWIRAFAATRRTFLFIISLLL